VRSNLKQSSSEFSQHKSCALAVFLGFVFGEIRQTCSGSFRGQEGRLNDQSAIGVG
jgi:hypothetical protein